MAAEPAFPEGWDRNPWQLFWTKEAHPGAAWTWRTHDIECVNCGTLDVLVHRDAHRLYISEQMLANGDDPILQVECEECGKWCSPVFRHPNISHDGSECGRMKPKIKGMGFSSHRQMEKWARDNGKELVDTATDSVWKKQKWHARNDAEEYFKEEGYKGKDHFNAVHSNKASSMQRANENRERQGKKRSNSTAATAKENP